MQFLGKSAVIVMAVIPVTAALASYAMSLASTTQSQELTIRFRSLVGSQPFECGKSYAGLGKPATKVTVSDFRFYVSDVALIDTRGKAVPLNLTQDGKWQYQNVALLDFENKSGACANGTAETRNQVVGTIPKGNYQGLQFTLGIPFNLNHSDSAIASSPLNLTSLWWNWRFGYKFARIDLRKQSLESNAGVKHGEQDNTSIGFPIHLGSTGCQAVEDEQKPLSCSNPNTSKVIFAKFNPKQNVVITDLAALVANTNLAVNQPKTAPGCMSVPDDGDCVGIMANFGLPFRGKPSSGQTFFRVE